MTTKWKAPRTFGDLRSRSPMGGLCRFCKTAKHDARKYNVRHYICDACIEPRKDVVLPAVIKREKFDAAMRAAILKSRST
jgi:hypothetical protein